jgi:hypothetical protein
MIVGYYYYYHELVQLNDTNCHFFIACLTASMLQAVKSLNAIVSPLPAMKSISGSSLSDGSSRDSFCYFVLQSSPDCV